MNEIRTVARRDSATTILRKLGINSRDYGLFIKGVADGFEVNVALAKKHVNDVAAQTAVASKEPVQSAPAWEEEKPVRPAKVAKSAKLKPIVGKPTNSGAVTISSVARDLILKGKPNAEVWRVLQAQFGLDDTKKHYPSWYRCQLRRQGLLAEEK